MEAHLLLTPRLARMLGSRPEHPSRLIWITDDIAISAAPTVELWRQVSNAPIKAVVDLREDPAEDMSFIDELALAYVHLPVREGTAPAVEELEVLTAWIAEHLSNRGAVLIHCREGRGRSALVACATLIRLGFTPRAAYSLIRRKQPLTALSSEQTKALKDFYRSCSLVGKNG